MASFKFGRWTLGVPAMLSVVAVILVAGAGTVHFSESPTFCNSCHIMAPYYKAWKASKHNHVACVECHYPPAKPQTLLWKKFQAFSQVAKYVTRTYSSKPFAEVDDASCLRSGCHSTRLLDGKVVAKNGVLFDHRPHLTEVRRGRQLRCVSCHSQVMVGDHIAVTYDTCFLCHFKGRGEGRDLKPVAGCTGCHELPKRDFKIGNLTYNHREFVGRGVSCQSCHRNIVQGEGAAPKERCLNCHNVPEILERYDDHALIHDKHVTQKNIACSHCHQPMKHGFGDGPKALPAIGAAAGAAAKTEEPQAPVSHPPTLTFDCALCHTDKHAGQLELYSGNVKALGLPEIPSPMFLARVDCSGCHYDKEKGAQSAKGTAQVTFRASHEACVKCHGPRYAGMWESIHQEVGKTVGALSDNLEVAAKAVAALAKAKQAAPGASLAKAQRLVDFVRQSHGEHNVYLTSVALRRAEEELAKSAKASSAKLADLSDQPLLSGSYCAVLCHEKAGVKVPRETVKHGGKTMPHAMHAGLMGCAKCHELGGHRRAPLKKGVEQVCAGCHAPSGAP